MDSGFASSALFAYTANNIYVEHCKCWHDNNSALFAYAVHRIGFGHCNCWRHNNSALFAYAIKNICAEWSMTASRQYDGEAGLRDLIIAMSYTHGLSLHAQLGMQSASPFMRSTDKLLWASVKHYLCIFNS